MKSLKKNIIYNSVYQFLIMFLPFVTAPYLSRVIGADGVGTYSYVLSVAQYFVFFAMLGLNNYGNRSIAAVNDNREKRSRVFSEIYCMQLITAFVSISIYIAYIIVANDKVSAIIMIAHVCSALFDVNWLFFGTENFKVTVFRNAAIKVSSLFAIFIFVKDSSDTYIYVAIMALATLISQMALWPFVKKIVDFSFQPWCKIRSHFKENIMLFIPVIAVSIYKTMDKIMLGQMASTASVGYYEYAEKIYNIPLMLVTAIGTVMLPRMTFLYSNHNDKEAARYFSVSMELVLAFANAAMFGLIAISNSFVEVFYGRDFLPCASILNYLSTTVVLLAAGNVLRTQYLIPQKKDKIYIKSAVYGAIINFGVNLILIPRIDTIGAVWGTIAAETIVFLYQFGSVRKNIDIKKYALMEFQYLTIGAVMFVVITHINITGTVASIIVKITVGCIIYAVLFVILFYRKYRKSPLQLALGIKHIDKVKRNSMG